MGNPTDVILSWFCDVPGLDKNGNVIPGSLRSKFTRPTKFIQMPTPAGQHYGTQIGAYGRNPLRGILAQYGVDKPLRVAVMGFSEGCQGARAILASQDAGYIEHALFFDGIHCSWTGAGTPNGSRDNIAPNCIGPVIAYADIAGKGPIAIGGNPPAQHHLTITHSSIIPPTFPSSTDTAMFILNTLYGSGWPVPNVPDGIVGAPVSPPFTARGVTYTEAPSLYTAGQHGFTVLGYYNLDKQGGGGADHIFQANVVLPAIIEKMLLPRWNSMDPTASVCAGIAGPASCNPVAPATMPPDYMTHPQDASLDWTKYISKAAEPGAPSVVDNVVAGGLSVLLGAGAVALGRWIWKMATAESRV